MCQKQKHSIVSPAEFSRLAQLANLDEYNQYTLNIKSYYQLGKGVAKISPNMNKVIDRQLIPFLVSEHPITGVAGIYTLPDDVEYIDTVIVNDKQADWRPYNLIQSYLDSTIDTPTADYPIYTDVATGLKVYPTSLTTMKLTYLKSPAVVNWGYTLVSSRPVYSETGTVNFEWGESHKMSLIAKILGYMGLTFRDGELKQMALQEEQKAN